jgi:putative hemolysin
MAMESSIFALILLLGLSGFFSASEVALVSLPRHKARAMMEKKRFNASYVVRLKDSPQRMLATILIGNNIVNVAASAITTSLALQLFDSYAIGIATGIMTLLILVFGEITPKSIAAQHNETVAQVVSPFLWYLSIILAPLLNVLDTTLNRMMRVLGIAAKEKAITEEEIKSMIQAAADEGTIQSLEKRMLTNIFEFDDMDVQEIMRPRSEMVMLSASLSVGDAIRSMLRKKYSRMPVYEKSRENIVGIVHIKDLLVSSESGNRTNAVSTVMKKPYVVPTAKKIGSLMSQFQKRKEHMAIVVDEHGSISGLVTLEDVLEEIVGEILDETDRVAPAVREISPGVWRIDGRTEISEAKSKTGIRLKDDEYDTISGFVLKQLGRIPKIGEEFTYGNYRVVVELLDGHRVAQVRVERTKT